MNLLLKKRKQIFEEKFCEWLQSVTDQEILLMKYKEATKKDYFD